MTNFADEDFYQSSFLCGKKAVIASAFDYYARAATLEITRYAGDNITEDNIPECAQMCCCEVAERLYAADGERTDGVTSESIGGWSRSYANAQESKTVLSADIKGIVYKWLPSELLYRGV